MLKGAQILQYVYDAEGNKLAKLLGNRRRDYIGELEFNNGVLEFIHTKEGRAIPTGVGYNYEYFLTDHLGAIRIAFQYGANGSLQVTQLHEQYPFGSILGNQNFAVSPSNNYLFGCKEYHGELGLAEYDFEDRYYDPVLGRWSAPDPANQFYHLSPYAAFANNPVLNTDLNGKILLIVAAVIVGAIIGGAINLAVHWNKIHNFQDGKFAFGIGAVAGGAGAALSTAAIIAAGGADVASGAGGVIAGMFGAGTGSVLSTPIQGVGNELYFHDLYGPVQFVNDVFFLQ